MKTYSSIYQLIGNTPLLELKNLKRSLNLKANIFAKLEYFNPAGSIKDRVALAMIEDAEKKGLLKKGGTVIEPTSGNTGIGICSVASAKGYKAIIVMPNSMSVERIKLMRAYGAEVVLTDGSLGMKGATQKAEELKNTIPNSIIAGQFTNKVNPLAHYNTTAKEIYNDLDGKVDILVSAVGTGGTITGVGKYLKEKLNAVKIVAVEPENSPLLSKGISAPHKIQGIGANFVPEILDLSVIDEIVCVSEQNAFSSAQMLGKTEGFLAGISSGASLYSGITLAQKQENTGKNIVVILPDGADRYLSTELFD